MDAVRTIQILRLLGLVHISSPQMKQLSLGAGPANKDMNSIHLVPDIRVSTNQLSLMARISFSMKVVNCRDIVITDCDPQRSQQYKLLNAIKNPKTIAINDDTFAVLEGLPAILDKHSLSPRNFIVALRIDHRMISDVASFFRLIGESIASVADLVVSIGSGFTVDDYAGRVNKLGEVFEYLRDCGLQPTLIKLHGSGTLEEQRQKNHFGLSNITTYQILHCKLKRKNLLP
jgi:hypothetical protein